MEGGGRACSSMERGSIHNRQWHGDGKGMETGRAGPDESPLSCPLYAGSERGEGRNNRPSGEDTSKGVGTDLRWIGRTDGSGFKLKPATQRATKSLERGERTHHEAPVALAPPCRADVNCSRNATIDGKADRFCSGTIRCVASKHSTGRVWTLDGGLFIRPAASTTYSTCTVSGADLSSSRADPCVPAAASCLPGSRPAENQEGTSPAGIRRGH